MRKEKQRYGLRKLSVGVVSCFLGSVIYLGAGMSVQAEEVDPSDLLEMETEDDSLAAVETDGNTIAIEEKKEDAVVDAQPSQEVVEDPEVVEPKEVKPVEKVEPAKEEEVLHVQEVLKGNLASTNNKGIWKFDTATGILTLTVDDSYNNDVVINGNLTTADAWRYNDVRNQVKSVVFETNSSGKKLIIGGVANYMFANMKNLTSVNFSKMGPIQANSLARMFEGCTSLKTVDMSGVTTTGNLSNMQRMFQGCTSLEYVYINNKDFKTRNNNGQKGAQMNNMFNGCTSLQLVDMSNITLTANTLGGQMDLPFTGATIQKIVMDNTKFVNVGKLDRFMSGVTGLKEVSMAGKVDVSGVTTMTEMFANNESLEKLDISGFGVLTNIVNMDDMLLGDVALNELNISNLDNSIIGPTSSRHTLATGQSTTVDLATAQTVGAKEFGRAIFGKNVMDIQATFPNLKKIIATNSKVWLVKNNRGLAGNEYYNVSADDTIVYLTKNNTSLVTDNNITVNINTKRGYVDILSDRLGLTNSAVNADMEAFPDKDTCLNTKNGHVNLNGAGFLAAGIYTISDEAWSEETLNFPPSYYRISYVGEVPFEVEGLPADFTVNEDGSKLYDLGDLLLILSDDQMWLNTKTKTWNTSGDEEIVLAQPITITYKGAAVDAHGQRHDVSITINSVKFKDLQLIPVWAGNEREHDSNRYIDRNPVGNNSQNQKDWGNANNSQYYRTILQATRTDGVTLMNYVRVGNGNVKVNNNQDWKVLSGGSGTDINFTVKVADALPGTTVLLYVDDLDVEASQKWERPNATDACYDYLPAGNVTFGLGGESFELDPDTFEMNSITFASETGLMLVGNDIISTGSDPSTPWSKFVARGLASGANITWKSGIGCTTYALLNTPTPTINTVTTTIEPFTDLTGKELEDGEFTFTIERTDGNGNDVVGLPEGSMTNTSTGIIGLTTLEFIAEGEYIFRLREIPGTDSRYTYASEEFDVIVNVTADPVTGKLSLTKLMRLVGGGEVDQLLFKNYYKTPQAPTPDPQPQPQPTPSITPVTPQPTVTKPAVEKVVETVREMKVDPIKEKQFVQHEGVQTGLESRTVGAFSTIIVSLGAMVALKKKDNK